MIYLKDYFKMIIFGSFMLFGGVKVKTHDFKRKAFLVKLVCFVEVWLAY